VPDDPLFDFAVPEDLLRVAVAQVRDPDVVADIDVMPGTGEGKPPPLLGILHGYGYAPLVLMTAAALVPGTFGNGIALINLMECWTCDSVDGDEQAMMSWFEEHGTFKNHQNHKEKVVLSVEHEDLHGGLMWMAEILRSEGEPARLGPWIAQSDGEQMQGRFYGFFNEPASA